FSTAGRLHWGTAAMRRRSLRVLVALMVGALALATSATSSSGAGSAPGVTDKQVTVGLVNPSSGSFGAQFGPYVDGVKARIYIANKAGGVNGRKIRLVIKDDAGDPSRSKT